MRRLVMLAALLAGGSARAQLASPGDLSRPHASLEGLTNCSKCHSQGEELAPDKCLSCHRELGARVDKRRGFHGRMADERRNKCEECHHEHQGRDLQLVENVDKLDHGRTGWALRGKHAGQKCATCHEPRRMVDADAIALFKKDPKTYLGLYPKCTTCHFDEHRGQLEGACDKCHAETAWKPARFDHQTAAFALAGKHKNVACAKCHPNTTDEATHPAFPPPRAASFMKLAPIAHSRCTDCHADPHQGRFSSNCESCHTVDGWMTVKNTAEERKFHDKTRFPLRGQHSTVACAACHGPFPGKPAKFRGLAHDQCMDCHSDAHRGQLAKPACERCHSVDGFRPARFELEQHQQTRFVLEGAHAAVPCTSCHPGDSRLLSSLPAVALPSGKKDRHHHKAPPPQTRREPVSVMSFRFTKPLDRCESCHSDPHAGQFHDGCGKCHSANSFTELRFDHARDSRFPLTGKHAEVQCGTCHRGNPVRYRPLETGCSGCHSDVHAGQLGADCVRCHSTGGWKPTAFNHGDVRFTSFALEGQHAKVKCEKCHTPIEIAPGRKVVRYHGLPRECEGCHSDAHHGQFKGFVP